MTTFDQAFTYTVGNEGGFTKDPNDKGNWTGGSVGVGVLKGTKYGISAASYPTLDIENLTIDQAKAIYQRDFWNKFLINTVTDPNIAIKIFDLVVNAGANAEAVVQLALRAYQPDLELDGYMGPVTIGLINKTDPVALLKGIDTAAGMYYWVLAHKVSSNFLKYLNGWEIRAFKNPIAN